MKALAFSGGKDSWAVLHLHAHELDCAIFVDTGFAYPETMDQVERARAIVPMHIVQSRRNPHWIPADLIPADWTEQGQHCTKQREAIVVNYHDCCAAAIARPLLAAAHKLGVTELFYGQRADESRKSTAKDGSIVDGIVRRHPIERWTSQEVLDYLRTKMTVPPHFDIKHSSLDCFDCTAYRKDSVDRVEWMRSAHPVFFQRYKQRADALDGAIREVA